MDASGRTARQLAEQQTEQQMASEEVIELF